MKSDAPQEGIPLKPGLTAADNPNLAEVSEVHMHPGRLQESQPGSDDHEHEDIAEPRLRDLPVTLWNVPRILLLALIRLYQATFSRALPADTCRFYPSCSHYGYQAIYKYGVVKGGLMAAWRVLRCNPFNRGGFDPVP